ncbi:YCII-related protein [Gloeocapsa sp. PCC 7428]|uniref:YciI family protein n=1 Tax=Gloeocapsa sp. PCC 7428 TaxID=1173026 RepID=UPI0002A60917|nr:YciI family protein [Gloeocapsa sp. PCC 7428]AFZ29621.1 YCII-related protein [Gloeocapsa sp. PCC 7428]
MPWFVKIEEGIVEKPEFDLHVPAHKAYVKELIANGHQARSGYWTQRGGGMMVFQAASLEEAKAIVAKDPLIQNGCVSYKLYEWQVVVE